VVVLSALIGWSEGWSPLDALYFVVLTISTVGFGEMAPQRDAAKVLTCVLICTSLGLLAAVLAQFQRAVSASRCAISPPPQRLTRRHTAALLQTHGPK